MASIINTNCKFVVVYTDNTTKTQQTLVVHSGETMTLPKNITVNSVTKFGSGCSIDTTCGTLPTTTNAECYGSIIIIGGGGTGCLNITGIILNNKKYIFNTPIEYCGVNVAASTIKTDLLTQINLISDLKNVIYDLCVAFINHTSSGTTLAEHYLISFRSVIGNDINSYFITSYRQDDNYDNDLYKPIVLRQNLPSTVLGVTLSTLCPCT